MNKNTKLEKLIEETAKIMAIGQNLSGHDYKSDIECFDSLFDDDAEDKIGAWEPFENYDFERFREIICDAKDSYVDYLRNFYEKAQKL